jgi:hypothetical protein
MGGFFIVSKKYYLQLYTCAHFLTAHGSPQTGPHGSAHRLAQPPNTELNNKPTITAIAAFFITTPL